MSTAPLASDDCKAMKPARRPNTCAKPPHMNHQTVQLAPAGKQACHLCSFTLHRQLKASQTLPCLQHLWAQQMFAVSEIRSPLAPWLSVCRGPVSSACPQQPQLVLHNTELAAEWTKPVFTLDTSAWPPRSAATLAAASLHRLLVSTCYFPSDTFQMARPLSKAAHLDESHPLACTGCLHLGCQ